MSESHTGFNDPYSIISLLPYTEDSQLIHRQQKLDDLYLLKQIVTHSLEALDCFISGKLKAFDAQVGENMCQIRAYKTTCLAKKWLISTEKRNEFSKKISLYSNYKDTLDQIISNWEHKLKHPDNYNKHNKKLDEPEIIKIFLLQHNLYVLLNQDELYLIMCSFLTRFSICKENVPIAIDINSVQQYFNISKFKSKKLIRKYQEFICKFGNKFIMQIAEELPSELSYKTILPRLCRNAENARQVLPCLMTTEIIINHCMSNNLPIVFIVWRKDNLGCTKDIVYFNLIAKDTNRFSLISDEQSIKYSPYGIIICGEIFYGKNKDENIQNYVKKILLADPKTLLLANTASHPQYTGEYLNSFKENPFQDVPIEINNHALMRHKKILMDLKEYASHKGCEQENKSMLFLRHIYANNIKEEIIEMSKNNSEKLINAYNIMEMDKKENTIINNEFTFSTGEIYQTITKYDIPLINIY